MEKLLKEIFIEEIEEIVKKEIEKKFEEINKKKFLSGKEVENILEISHATLYNLRKREELKENKHFVLKGEKVVYIAKAIFEFKKEYVKHAKSQQLETKILNSFTENFLKEVA